MTTARGLFRLTGVHQDTRELWASAPGYLMQRQALDEREAREWNIEDLVLTLELASSEVSGSVVDASGGAVPGAIITARLSGTSAVAASAVSDTLGMFSFGAPQAPLEISADAEAYSRAIHSVEPPAAALTFVLAPASVILGQVIAADTGEPLSGLMVEAEGQNGLRVRASAETEADGRFRLGSLPAGGYSIGVLADDWRSELAWSSIGVGQSSEPLLLRVLPAVTFSAVVSTAGEPCRGGQISLTGPVTRSSASDQEGRVRLQGLPPGRYQASVQCEPAWPVTEVVELERSLERSWDLSLGLAVRGRVESASGQPVVGARVGVQPLRDPAELAQVTQAPAHWLVECLSDARGEFSCPGVGEGKQQCSLLDRRGAGVVVNVTTNDSPQIVLRADASGTIRAALPSTGSQQLPEQIAFAENASGRLSVGRRQPGGYAFEHLALGPYRVFLGPPGRESDARSVVLEADGQIIDVSFPLPKSTAVAGRVIDEQEQPVLDAWVRAAFAESVSEQPRSVGVPVLTDEHGAFRIDGLAPGRYDLKVTSHAGEAALFDVEGGTLSVVMRLPSYGSLVGSVLTSNGTPVPEFELTYARKDRPAGRVRGSAGHWTVPWLEPGEYALSVETDQGFAARTLTLAAGEQRSLELTLNGAASAESASAATPSLAGAERSGDEQRPIAH
jgi:hypothetical protein